MLAEGKCLKVREMGPEPENTDAIAGEGTRSWMRRWRPYAAAILIAVGALGTLVGSAISLYLLNRPTGVARREVLVEKGMTVSEIAGMLHRRGIIRSPALLRVLAVVGGTSRGLKAGTHRFHGGMTTQEVLEELRVPRAVTRSVTIPEGLRRERIAGILADELGLDAGKLAEMMADPRVAREHGVEADHLEGYLFPETYSFSVNAGEKQVVRRMVEHFHRVFDGGMRHRAREMGMSVHEVVTLASIIEGEARLDEERALISAVYHNRLRARMRLQADPTVQYAITDGPRRLFNRDYQVNSPYNTYRRRGLPPGPIMSPGEASLRAALYPEDVDYLYFVAQGDGSHIFSRTIAEHEGAKRRTRRARRRSW